MTGRWLPHARLSGEKVWDRPDVTLQWFTFQPAGWLRDRKPLAGGTFGTNLPAGMLPDMSGPVRPMRPLELDEGRVGDDGRVRITTRRPDDGATFTLVGTLRGDRMAWEAVGAVGD